MKQVLQDLRSGQTNVVEVPAPAVGSNHVLIRTHRTLISAGTERMLVEFGKASLLAKARSQPDKVKQVLDKIKTDGLLPTLEAVFNRLGEPLPLGYCNAGEVLEVGSAVTKFQPGDRVASNGPHAEIVAVPKNLCARIPDDVTYEQASFTVLSSVALQGVRLVQPALGEKVVVYGLGLVGLLSVQILLASGCQVMGVDLSPARLALAEKCGASAFDASSGDVVSAVMAWTGGVGADAVLIGAAAKTDEIMHNAALMSRKRGRIVMTGNVGMSLRRGDYYEKELTIQVSCSYGPGRYDELYEQRGQDYPLAFVRWTEGRNFQAILGMLNNRSLVVDDLITDRYPIAQAADAYAKLSDSKALATLLEYPDDGHAVTSRHVRLTTAASESAGGVSAALIGAGNFAKVTLMPAMAKSDAKWLYVASRGGVSAQHLAKKFKIPNAVTDYRIILADPAVNLVVIALRHDQHAKFLIEALDAGKHVFVEKPLAVTEDQLLGVLEAAGRNAGKQIMVGFNRRFSPHIEKARQLLASRTEPLSMSMMVNAGQLPPDHWHHDPVVGGGRIIGEGCHYIDLMTSLAGSVVRNVSATRMGPQAAIRDDKMSINLSFEDGSVGTVSYFANGPKNYPKEVLQVFSQGRVLALDNFRVLRGYGFPGFKKLKTFRQDKGHAAEFAALVGRIRDGGAALIPLDELVSTTLASIGAMTSSHEERTVTLAQEYPDVVQVMDSLASKGKPAPESGA